MKNFFLCALLSLALLTSTVHAQGESTTTASTTDTVTVIENAPADEDLNFKRERIPNGDQKVGDFVVGPGKLEVEVRPGESVTKEIMLTNRIDDNRRFEFVVEDMSGSTDGSQSVVLLGDQKGPYSLKDYIAVPKKPVTLSLGERVRIPVTITMPPNAEPGGYYGSVLVTTVQDDGTVESGSARSPIVARIGTLFFITVPGKANIEGSVTKFGTLGDKWLYAKGPINLGITYENKGSVHLNPKGELRITNILGAEVGFVTIEPWFILPKSIRTREISWDAPFLLGRYKLTATIDRGYNGEVDTLTTVVWVMPWQVVVPVFVGLFLFIFLTRLFFNKFEFKRK